MVKSLLTKMVKGRDNFPKKIWEIASCFWMVKKGESKFVKFFVQEESAKNSKSK
jgi:hypothetical protein